MSCPALVKIVKAYTYGEIPLEVYREKRRQIVNEFIYGVEKPVKKKDPLDSFIASAPEKTTATHKSLFYAITAATLAVVLAIGIGLLLYPSSDSTTKQLPQQAKQEFDQIRKPQAQELIESFIHADQWNEESVNQFILDWQILSVSDRQQAQNTSWYKHFVSTIKNRLDSQIESKQVDSRSKDLTTTLLATVDPGHFINNAFFGQASAQRPEVTSKPSTPTVVAKKEPVQKVLPTEESKRGPKVQPSKPTPSKAAKSIDSRRAEGVLNHFVKSFEDGNLNNLMKLFSPNATTNHHTSADEISASYSELFQTTAKRDLKFSDFSWKPAGNKLEGNGKYLAHLNPKDTNVEQIFSADVTVLVDTASQPAVIAGLYLSNQQFSTSLAESIKSAVPAAQKIPPPGKEELRTLLQKFVASYNRGDVESLISLFSQEARTNDRTNVNEIREDYAQLFQTTKSREITLSDVTWKFTANTAVASGLFEAKIQPISNKQINVYRGKIRIAVTKYEGGLLITQLLHNTQ